MTYTREQINRGEGILTSGETTLIWEIAPGEYITTTRGEKPMGRAELVGHGRRRSAPLKGDQWYAIDWADG